MNLPLHCFGYHANCSSNFCKTAQQHNTNNVTPATHEQHNSCTAAIESNLTSATDNYDTNNSGIQLSQNEMATTPIVIF